MNDKRFEINDGVVYDKSTNKKYDAIDCCKLLNEYYDKIISLENEVDFLQMENNGIKYVLKNIRQIELKRW